MQAVRGLNIALREPRLEGTIHPLERLGQH
jgi:hypothetical protein